MLIILFQPGIGPWHTVFYLAAGLLLLEALIFTAFASGVEQPWNKDIPYGNGDMNLELRPEAPNKRYKYNGNLTLAGSESILCSSKGLTN